MTSHSGYPKPGSLQWVVDMTNPKHPRPVTPLGALVAGAVIAVAIFAMGWFGGDLNGQSKAWREQDQLLRASSLAVARYVEIRQWQIDIEPWVWFLDCDPNPFAHLQSWDEARDLVSVACPPGILIPEEES